jgi:succinyl-CoA synthetase alpha subunit
LAILVDAASRIVIQGITGINGRNLASRMLEAGTPLVAGVTPGRGGKNVAGVPVFDSCWEAVQVTGANASFVSVPAPLMLDACLEAIEAGIRVVTAYTEGVPVTDSITLAAHARAHGAVVLGPNAAGCVSPGLANLSDLNDANLDRGRVGIVSKSGTLTYEVIDGLRRTGLGQSTIACLGGDPVVATGHADILRLFEEDPGTEAVVLVGEIGGRSELIAAEVIATMTKPVVAYIAGRSAPPGKPMGHAGALLGASEENVPAKSAALAGAGAVMAREVIDIAPLVADLFTRGVQRR